MKVLIRVSTLLGRRFVKTARWEDGRMGSVSLGPASNAVDLIMPRSFWIAEEAAFARTVA
jgi:hypothetical protein